MYLKYMKYHLLKNIEEKDNAECDVQESGSESRFDDVVSPESNNAPS